MRMKLFNKPVSLQEKLTYLPLLWLGVGLLLTFTVTAIFIKTALDNYLMSQVKGYTQQIAKDVRSIIEQDQETLTAFSLAGVLEAMNEPQRLTIALERLLSRNKNFLESYVLDPTGKTVAGASRLRAAERSGLAPWNRAIFLKACQGQIAVAGWENFTQKYQPYWHMALPITGYPGKVKGVLLTTIDLRRLSDTILTSDGARYGEPLLLDDQGMILVHLDRSKLGARWQKASLTRRVISGKIATAQYSDAGKYVLAAIQELKPYGWVLVVQVPPGQTIYYIRNQVILLLGLMTIVMFVLTGGMTYAAAGKIVNPLRQLTETTRRFGQGKPVEYAEVEGEDEIAELAAAFNQMALNLTDLEKQRAQYISMIAHDLRNPITAIGGICQSLQMAPADAGQGVQNVPAVQTKLEQVNRMLNDLLDFSRLDLGKVRLQPEAVSLYYLCQDVVSGYLNRQRLRLTSFPETILAWADPVRLQQIIQNILDNCLKYTPDDTMVTITGATEDGVVSLIISDAGRGMSPAVLETLFQPFQRHATPNRDSYGLGMAIAKKLALAMNGDIFVSSREQIGSVFTIVLPRAASDSAPLSSKPDEA